MVADIKTLRKKIKKILDDSSSPMIVDGHYSTEVVDRNQATLIIVLRRAPWILRTELSMRGYKPQKVRENVEAELLGSCLMDALETQDHRKVCEIDTTNLTPQETVKRALTILRGEITCGYGRVDWMNQLETEKMLRGF
jgi:adenylate kinase